MRIKAISLIPCLLATMAEADAPHVVVDTGPLHSIVASVMLGAGVPDLLIAPGVSPHDFALRPSDAARLSQADVLIWSGPALAPWLDRAAQTLAPQAATLGLLAAPGWAALPLRDDPAFDTDATGHDQSAPIDPHAWLDPGVAADWADLVAAHLASADPANAALYADNAATLRRDLAALDTEIAGILAGAQGAYLVPHDAYQYFEVHYALPARGAIALSDASASGLAHLSALRAMIEQGEIACVLTDLETNPNLAAQLAEDTAARIEAVDPDGLSLPPGPGLYPALMRDLATGIAACLAG